MTPRKFRTRGILTMNLFLRILAAVCLLALAALCSLPLWTYAEPALTNRWGLRVLYGLAGSGCLLGSVLLVLPKEPDRERHDPIGARAGAGRVTPTSSRGGDQEALRSPGPS